MDYLGRYVSNISTGRSVQLFADWTAFFVLCLRGISEVVMNLNVGLIIYDCL